MCSSSAAATRATNGKRNQLIRCRERLASAMDLRALRNAAPTAREAARLQPQREVLRSLGPSTAAILVVEVGCRNVANSLLHRVGASGGPVREHRWRRALSCGHRVMGHNAAAHRTRDRSHSCAAADLTARVFHGDR